MSRITLTIHIDVPDGAQVTPDVSYSSPQPRPAPAVVAPPATAGSWVCPEHGSSKVVPAGTSKKTGKPYNAFTACGETGCDQKPPRGPGPAQYTPPIGPEGMPPPGQFDELPF